MRLAPKARAAAALLLLGFAVTLPACRSQSKTTPSSEAPQIRFVDATSESGIHFRHSHGGSGKKFMPETNGSGVAWLDYDGDGWQDLLFVNCAPLPGTRAGERTTPRLYRNRGDGTFEDRTRGSGLNVSLYGQGVAVADFDADGDPDVFIACLGPNRLFRNEGNGRFTDLPGDVGAGDGPDQWRYHTGAVWLDYDRDGWLDLFVARYARWTPETDPFCGVPGEIKRYCPPWKSPQERCALYRNLGNGRFRDVSAQTGVSRLEGHWFQPLVLDYNSDGWPDVAVSSDGTPTALLENGAGKRFTDVATATGLGLPDTGSSKAQMGIDAADWRNQGREAVLIGNFAGERLSLFELDQPGAYVEATDRAGLGASSLFSLTFGVAFLDADRDGWTDAFVANGHIDDYIERFEANVTYAQPPLFYRNVSGSRFEEISGRAGPALSQKMVARGCAVADFDQDGDPDLVVTENHRPAHLLRNDTPSPHRSLRVVLKGRSPNRDAIGARVEVSAGGLKQVRWLRAGGHYLSQSEFPLLFGLGSASTADVSVTWPGGSKTVRKAVPGGTLRVDE